LDTHANNFRLLRTATALAKLAFDKRIVEVNKLTQVTAWEEKYAA
jgi:hypothetical protein